MEEERIYTIPLRDVTNKSPTTKRAPRAIRAIREFLKKHMKSDIVKLDNTINEKVWERSLNKIPAKVRVKVVKEGDVVKATLVE
ncbi:50S ribosomal protein L31e [Methanococcus maripaludis]|jgi:large subunit ribosomal protein L31e|uniref:Large ribosomal subunit protein eL31 n=6 Tax=Methanococcus maripaludis TaxID=39152 RepID=RL31_METMP|nr:50S ribosomal protein L31e [Methanococcus maripaludis]Q6M155.1 RecName: Full=Large ribosomal subunit protein eL31; AltName: Full=50S ribosomal protein L31e [Methanococcus maripaludis S2]MDK2928645.1 large subunit ribosomal protein L31e [Methanococcus sp.]AEK18955.1 50S ribosomal protein L31e [Methanococcus maripaludis X1]AVB76432.1 50S ribosomal protein L31e [Methanococcus maripaludis]MBA2840460.1 large subunit ribosomal protein L31e [Methanococcus maripaludis]MBA2845852.1 large subunit ri